MLGPVYIAEIAPAKWRGMLVGSFQINIVIGILVAYLSNFIIGRFNLGLTEWRWMLGVAALPAVLVRFTLVFYAAFKVMPPPTVLGPKVWDHSYYALEWHTLHWQQILYQLRLLPDALSNSFTHVTSKTGPAPVTAFLAGKDASRLEFWWLRARDLGTTAVVVFALLPIAAAVAGVRTLNRYLVSAPPASSAA